MRDDASTPRSLVSLTRALEPLSPVASAARETAEKLLTRCDSTGRIPDRERLAVQMLVGQLESGLA